MIRFLFILAYCLTTAVLLAQQTRQQVNVGTNPNDGTGDPLRTSFIKLNTNDLRIWRTLYTNLAVNVRDFGAVGDGLTDDTTAINTALAAAQAQARALHFPPGVYVTSGMELDNNVVAITGWNVPAEKFAGEANTVIRQKANSTNALVKWKQGARTSALNILFDGNSTNQVSSLDVAVVEQDSPSSNRDEVYIFGCTFFNGRGRGLVIRRPEVYLHNVHAILNRSHGIVYDGPSAGYGASDCTLDYVGSGFNGGDGILMASPASANRLRNVDSYFNQGCGITLSNTLGTIRMEMVQANNNFQHALNIAGGQVSAITAANSIFVNSNWHDNSFGTTNSAATGTYSDVYLGASLGVFSTAIQFANCNLGQAIGAPQVLNPKYALEDARSGGPSTNGLGVTLIGCFSSPDYAFGSGKAIQTNVYQRGFVINHSYLDNTHGDTYLGKSDKTWLGSEINMRPLGSTMTNWNGIKQYLYQSGGYALELNSGGTAAYYTVSSNGNTTVPGWLFAGSYGRFNGTLTNYDTHKIETTLYTNGVGLYIFENGGLGFVLNEGSGSEKYAQFYASGNVNFPAALTNAAELTTREIYAKSGATIYFQSDLNTTTNETPLAVLVNGTLRRVSVGTNDSGGTGFRLLRIAN